MARERVIAALLLIGDELLSGRTRDANLSYIAKWLGERDIELGEARVIADDETAIVAALNECRQKFDYVFTTGGIGPTHDDITAGSVAAAFGVALELRADAVALLEQHYGRGGLNEARLRMARLPQGARIIHNPVSMAPGFQLDNVFVLAGVPRIMQVMLDDLDGRLDGGQRVHSITVRAALGESVVAGELADIQRRFSDVDIGSYPSFHGGRPGVSLVARGIDRERLQTVRKELVRLAAAYDGNPIEGEESD